MKLTVLPCVRYCGYINTVLFFLALSCLVPTLAHAHEELNSTVIHMTESGFDPEHVTVQQGETVIFENVDVRPRWPASDMHPIHTDYPGSGIYKCHGDERETLFDSCEGIEPNTEYSFSFTQDGVWYYHDHLYPQYGGSVTVTKDPAYIDEDTVRETTWFDEAVTTGVSVAYDIYYTVMRTWYSMFPERVQKNLESVDMSVLVYNEAKLRHWMRLFGHDVLLDKVIRDVKMKDSSLGCHVEGHFIGRMAHNLFKVSPLDGIDERCEFGYLHGTLEVIFDKKNARRFEILDEMAQYCDRAVIQKDYLSCHHGLGHGIMLAYDYDLPEALRKCGSNNACYSGVFMENAWFTSGKFDELALHTTEWLSDDDPHFPCNAMEEMFPDNKRLLSRCYNEQVLHMWELLGRDRLAVIQECLRIPEEKTYLRGGCFRGIGFGLATIPSLLLEKYNRSSPSNAKEAMELCQGIPDEYVMWCLNGIYEIIGSTYPDSRKGLMTDICMALENETEPDSVKIKDCWDFVDVWITGVNRR